MKLLYLGKFLNNVASGADLVNKRNQILLQAKNDVSYLPLKSGFFTHFFLGISSEYIDVLDKELSTNQYDFVFIPQSLLGRACKHIKKKYPGVRIIVFFHNIEVQYAREYLKTKGIRALPFYIATKFWEKQCCLYADYCITLNNRDSKLLQTLYNRKADLELPTSFDDQFDMEILTRANNDKRSISIDYLFVGVAFFANTEAVQWFINEVMPKVNGHLHVVGNGMDKFPFSNLTDRIHIHGYVDDLSVFYYRAKIVVSPIHVGGGMKTKTAEALMYGKTILGSKEAFEGYQMDPQCTVLCNTAEDYVREIKRRVSDTIYFNVQARNLFVANYSTSVLRQKFNLFIETVYGK